MSIWMTSAGPQLCPGTVAVHNSRFPNEAGAIFSARDYHFLKACGDVSEDFGVERMSGMNVAKWVED